MKIIKVKNYRQLSKKACEVLIKEINKKQNLSVGFATGKTPLGFYRYLVKEYKKGKVNFSEVRAFNLDEYYPLKRTKLGSFYFYLFKNLFNKINIKKSNIKLLNGGAKNPEKECLAYEKKLRKAKIDVFVLGVGINGHIAFNEPWTSFNSKTRVVDLGEVTIKNNSSFFKGKVPKKALTIGISTILKAKKIILLANGFKKSIAIKHLIRDKPNINWPVTSLKKHKDFVIIVNKGILK